MPAYSENTYNFPGPCGNYDVGYPWNGPKTLTICTDTILNLNSDPAKKCCYTITFYDRDRITHENILGIDYTQHDYEMNTVGIVFDGNGCEERKTSEIVQAFELAQLRIKFHDDKNIFIQHEIPYSTGGAAYSQEFWTTGNCFQKDIDGKVIVDKYGIGVPCTNTDEFYCCQYEKIINFLPNAMISLDTIGKEYSDPLFSVYKGGGFVCQEPCLKSCYEVKMVNKRYLTNTFDICNPPCNEGVVTEKYSEELTVPGCPNCKFKIKYLERIVKPCPDNDNQGFDDCYIKSIEMVDFNTCGTCFLSTNEMMKIATKWIAKNGFSHLQFQGLGCETNYRSFMASCWKDHVVRKILWSDGSSTIEEWGSNLTPMTPIIRPNFTHSVEIAYFRIIEPCITEKCCYQRYKICIDPITLNPVITILETNSSSDTNCGVIELHPCLFICFPNWDE